MNANLRLVIFTVVVGIVVVAAWLLLTREQEPAPPVEQAAAAKRAEPAPETVRPAPAHVDEPARTPRATEVTRAEAASPTSEKSGDAGIGRISGLVVDVAAQPVAGVAVSIEDFDWREIRPRRKPEVTRTTTTDASGLFEIARLPLKYYRVKAASDDAVGLGYAYLRHEWPMQEVEIVLKRCGPFQGRVVDSGQSAVAVALVEPMEKEGDRSTGPMHALSAESDDEGNFTITHLPEGRWKFYVEAEGYPHLISEFIAHNAQNTTFVLEAGGSLAGTAVLADTGEAVPNLEVVARAKDYYRDADSVKTDADGAFRFASLRPSEYMLMVKDEVLVLAKEAPPRTVTVGQETSGVILDVVEGGTITGTVLDAETGEGVPNVNIDAHPDGGRALPSRTEIRTGGDGRYRIAGLGVGRYRLMRGATKGYKNAEWQDAPVVSIAPGQHVDDMDFELQPTPAIAGSVVDAQDQPVAGAQITARPTDRGNMSSAMSEDDGRFELTGFAAGQEILISAKKHQVEGKVAEPVVVGEDGVDGLVIKLDVKRTASIAGVVVDGHGRPLENVQVMTSTDESRMFGRRLVATDKAGTFTIVSLSPGTYRMQLSTPNTWNFSTHGNDEQVTLREGEQRTGVRLVMAVDDSLAIEGRVTDDSGKPLERAGVNASGPTHGYTNTDKDGRYKIVGLQEGSYHVYANHHAHSSDQRPEVAAGSKNVDFRLAGRGSIEGRVVNAGTRGPVVDFQIAHFKGEHSRIDQWMMRQFAHNHDADGRFVISSVEVGDNTVVVRAPAFAPGLHVVRNVVADRAVTNVVIELEGGMAVEGVVINADGEPVGGAQVFVGSVPDQWQRSQAAVTITKNDGSFLIDTLSATDTRVSAYHPDYAPGAGTFTPAPSRTAYVEIVLRSGGRIEGVVTEAGEPVPRAQVSGEHVRIEGSDRGASASTREDGTYSLAGLANGEYMVRAYLPNPIRNRPGRSMRRPAVVAVEQVTVVDFDFLPADSAIEGVVTLDGKPVANFSVEATIQTSDGEERIFERSETGDGAYRIEPVPAGYVDLKVRAGNRTKIVPVNVPAGQVVHVDVAFGGAGSIAGTVTSVIEGLECGVGVLVGELERPSSLSITELMGYQQLMIKDAPIGDDGTYRVEDLEPGVYSLVGYCVPTDLADLLTSPQVRYGLVYVTVEEGAEATADIALDSTASLLQL